MVQKNKRMYMYISVMMPTPIGMSKLHLYIYISMNISATRSAHTKHTPPRLRLWACIRDARRAGDGAQLRIHIEIYMYVCLYLCVCRCVCMCDFSRGTQAMLRSLFKGELPCSAEYVSVGTYVCAVAKWV